MQNFGSLTFEVMTVTPGKSKKSVKQNINHKLQIKEVQLNLNLK